MRAALITALAALALSACASTTPLVSSKTDDMGRLHLANDPGWTYRVSVTSNNPSIQDEAEELVRENFAVNLAPLPKAWLWIRVDGCSTKEQIFVCSEVIYGGKTVFPPLKVKGPHYKFERARQTLEDLLFRDNAGLVSSYVDRAMDATDRKRK